MEAFRSLVLGDLPPAGHAINISGPASPLPLIPGYQATWLDSGTAALALALLDIKKQRPEIDNPEVILPAYCCPDLVAAAKFAGYRPTVADISSQDTAYAYEPLTQNITPNTIAIVAMTFLGVREDWSKLLPFLHNNHPSIKIIEDNAQWFPDLNGGEFFHADYLVFSFGRGKPLSILGGGALFSKFPLADHPISKSPKSNVLIRKLKYATYNWLLNPHLFWLLNHNPFFKLGQTTYCPITVIQHLDEFSLEVLSYNLSAYRARSRHLENMYSTALTEAGFTSEYLPLGSCRQHRLLRYPLLCRNLTERNALLDLLCRFGLGASPMYKLPITAITSVSDKIYKSSPIFNATDFANRLLTLPIHEGVKEKHLERLIRILKAQ